MDLEQPQNLQEFIDEFLELSLQGFYSEDLLEAVQETFEVLVEFQVRLFDDHKFVQVELDYAGI